MPGLAANVTDGQTDRQTDDVQSQYRALHCSASRGKNVMFVSCKFSLSIEHQQYNIYVSIYRKLQLLRESDPLQCPAFH